MQGFPRIIVLAHLLLAAAGCERDPGPACDRARDLLTEVSKQTAADAIASAAPEQHAELHAKADEEIARAHGRFRGLCVALPPEGQACIEKMGDMLAAHRQRKERGDAAAAADAEFASCEEMLEPFMAKLYAP